MKTKYLISFIIIFAVIGAAVLSVKTASAQETAGTANIQYPVKELGNCQNETSCKAYCDKPENTSVCLDFAAKNNLMSKEEIDAAKKFTAAGNTGPGGCSGKDACETYCNDISHIDACVSYAEKNNLMSPQDLAEAKQIQAAIAKGVKPPACKNKKECDTYCEDPNHMEECITFGQAAGFIQGKELEDSQKMLAALKRGVKPPPCKGKDACDQYCGDPNNMEVCMNFASEAGFMTDQEKADSQKTLAAIKQGIKPPACRGKEECDAYCSQDAHFNECTTFAVAAGFMSPQDAEMARKTGGKGPGGCKGKDECENFCNNPDNQQTCFNFAKDNGLIPPEDLKQMEQGKQQFKQSLEQAPSAVLDCLNSSIGGDLLDKYKSGELLPPKDIGEKMETCFKQNMPQGGQGGPGGPGAGGNMAPGQGGQNFQPGPGAINPGGQMMPQQAGPGGCKTPEECQSYCQANPQECEKFNKPENQGPGGQEQNRPKQQEMQGQPGGQPGPQPGQPGQQFQQPPEGMTPPKGQYQQYQPGTMPPGNQQQPNQSSGPMPPANQQPPAGYTAPSPYQQTPSQPAPTTPPPAQTPPPTQTTPPPSNTTPPSSSLNTNSLSGSIMDIINKLLQK